MAPERFERTHTHRPQQERWNFQRFHFIFAFHFVARLDVRKSVFPKHRSNVCTFACLSFFIIEISFLFGIFEWIFFLVQQKEWKRMRVATVWFVPVGCVHSFVYWMTTNIGNPLRSPSHRCLIIGWLSMVYICIHNVASVSLSASAFFAPDISSNVRVLIAMSCYPAHPYSYPYYCIPHLLQQQSRYGNHIARARMT